MHFEKLAEAVIVQAATEYTDALKRLKRYPGAPTALETKAECEQFFLSDWYEKLSTVDGGWLLKELRKEAGV